MKNAESFAEFQQQVRDQVENYLARTCSSLADTEVSRAAKYVVLGGGNRWRAQLAIAAGRIFSADALDLALPGACSVELAHAASLVLDDLPSMDNAELRRGKQCVHLVFSRWVVDMLPTFLVTLAYQIGLDHPRVSHDRRVAAVLELGLTGLRMVEGQEWDLTQPQEGHAESRLLECYRRKSGALYSSAAKAGAILCGASAADADLLGEFGMSLGLSYQFLDDVADQTLNVEELGKRPGMDVRKLTAVAQFGVDGAKQRARQFKEEALEEIARFGPSADMLRGLVIRAGLASLA